MKSYKVRANIDIYDNGKTEILYEIEPEVFVDEEVFVKWAKEKADVLAKDVEKSKKIGKKALIKRFLKKAIAKRKEKKEKARPFEERYKEAIMEARQREIDFGYGAGQEYLDEWEAEHEDEIDAFNFEKRKKKLKFENQYEYEFEFGIEVGGYNLDGLKGFVDTYYKQTKKDFNSLSKAKKEALARKILKTLFPSAKRFDALSVSAFTNPMQQDGGIKLEYTSGGIKSRLIYEKVYRPERDRDYLKLATEIVTKEEK